jgi:hypothetical protein
MSKRLAFQLFLFLSAYVGGCGGDPFVATTLAPPGVMSEGAAPPEQVPDRQVIYRAAMDVTVEDPMAAAAQVEALVGSVSGYIDRSEGGEDDKVEMNLRVPASSLDEVMDGIRPLGEVESESLNTTDVTSRVVDLDARIQSLSALRDRLRTYIDRATSVDEIITIERELTRVQTEIERLTAELTRMRGQVAMSEISVTLDRDHTDGPVVAAGKGVAWFFEKLFVWN